MKGPVAKKKINPKQMHKEFLDSIEPELLKKSVVFFDEALMRKSLILTVTTLFFRRTSQRSLPENSVSI